MLLTWPSVRNLYSKYLKTTINCYSVRGTSKLYFTHYSCVVIVLFNTGSTIYFRELDFRLYVIIMSRTSFRLNPRFIVCLNVKELLAQSRCDIWNLSDRNRNRTPNHLVCKRTLSHLAKLTKWFSCFVSTYLHSRHSSVFWPLWLHGWVFVYELSGCRFESRCCHSDFRLSVLSVFFVLNQMFLTKTLKYVLSSLKKV